MYNFGILSQTIWSGERLLRNIYYSNNNEVEARKLGAAWRLKNSPGLGECPGFRACKSMKIV